MPFKKGQSGNPRGRPKSDFALSELARQRTPTALQVLDEIMADKGHPARIMAVKEILDRGWGKPAQEASLNVIHEAGDTLTALIDKIRSGHASEPLGGPVVEVGELVQLPPGGGGNCDSLSTESGADDPVDSPDYEATRTPLRHQEQAVGG